MVHYRKARQSDADELIDFINYVFSFDHEPHDFKARNPKMYGGAYPFWDDHYVAEENGKLLATLSVTKRERNGCLGGHIAQVCVHPYHRGRGFMKALMTQAIDDMKRDGFVFAELNGLRQRYEYFGFTQGGVVYRCRVTATNLRHKPADSSAFSLQWAEHGGYTVLHRQIPVGTINGNNILLDCNQALPAVLQCYLSETGKEDCILSVSPYDTERLSVLTQFCEEILLTQSMQYRIFRFREAITACLQKRKDLRDGSCTIAPIGEEPFTVTVQNGLLSVTDSSADIRTDSSILQRTLFGLTPSVLMPENMAKTNWFPLVFD